jgi:addiction module RelB/DinJ family antitoxin
MFWWVDDMIPEVYTFGMSDYAIINLKTDPELKRQAALVAEKLGISISAVLNNELRRFTAEQSVVFDMPEAPNEQTAAQLASSRVQIAAGDYHKFDSGDEALTFLADQLK